MKPRYPMQSTCRQHCEMLQIALAPAPIAGGEIQQRWRAFLKAATQRGHHPDRPSGSTHKCRFHKIVAENVAAERLATFQIGQTGIPSKCANANDCVMAPIIALGSMPPYDACGDQRAV